MSRAGPLPVLLLGAALTLAGGCDGPNLFAPEPELPAAAATTVELADLLTGSFTSAAQAKVDADYREIHLESVRIWASRGDGPWLYTEQAQAGALDRPYRQRIYRLVESTDASRAQGTVEARVFELPGDPLGFAGLWKEPKNFDALKPDELLAREGCTVFLAREDEEHWIGSTDADSCPSALRGASYATTQMDVTASGIRLWDRGFDANGKQVWGAVKGPYRFERAAGK